RSFRSTRSTTACRNRRASVWCRRSRWISRSRALRSAIASTSSCAAAKPRRSACESPSMSKLTPSQTIGPFFHEALKWAVEPLTGIRGAVRVGGRVLDRDARPVNDALIEVWQPAWEIGPRLQRAMSDDDGRFAFLMPIPEHGQGHANVTLFARGLLRGLFTRAYLHA